MKKAILLISGMVTFYAAFAQTKEEFRTAAVMQAQRGRFDSAQLTLQQGLTQNPNDMDLLKDKGYMYVLGRDFSDALLVGQQLTQRTDADDQCYQILGMVYDSLNELDEGAKMYKKALQKFPSSGVLYSGYGHLLYMNKKPDEAIGVWEQGIKADVNNSNNYYYAAKYYAGNNLLWSLLYGEIFVNMESLTQRTGEIKDLLYNGYVKLFTAGTLAKINAGSKGLTKDATDILVKNKTTLSGDTIQNLTAIRQDFLVTWVNSGMAKKYPFRLFDLHRQLIEAKTFTAYNQWLFGEVSDKDKYDQWATAHNAEMQQWLQLLHSVVFKIPAGQYYTN